MAYTFLQIQAEVRNNINNQTASVTTVIDQAVNLFSNFFNLEKIDATKSTVAGTDNIAQPSNCLDVSGLKIGDDYLDKIPKNRIEEAEDHELQKFYTMDDGKIYIIPTPSAVETVKIWFKSGFTPMAGAGSTDVPDKLVPALILLATWLYFNQITTQTGTARELFPDMTPEEAEKIAQGWKKHFDEIIKLIKTA